MPFSSSLEIRGCISMKKAIKAMIGLILCVFLIVSCMKVEVPEEEEKVTEQPEEEKVTYESKLKKDVEYKLSEDLSKDAMSFMSGGEMVFINLVDTKVDSEVKSQEYETEEGFEVAHMLKFEITSNKDEGVDVYVVPSYEEYEKFRKGENFKQYSSCRGATNECYVSFTAGMIIVNKADVTAKVERSIQVYSPR
jgi:hypothetical protein